MKTSILKSTLLSLIVLSPMCVMAEEPSQKPDITNSPIHAIAHIPIAGVKIATGAVAIPLMIVGEIGNISGQAGEQLWQQASRPVSDSTRTADTKFPSGIKETFL